jgi:hypothetical protein
MSADITTVVQSAEERFFRAQPEFEKAAVAVLHEEGQYGAEAFATQYTGQCLKQVGCGYHELVDYLMFRYLVDHAEVVLPKLPVIGAPVIPDRFSSASR